MKIHYATHYKGAWDKCNYCIRYQMNKGGFSSSDLRKALGISLPTVYKLIENPFLMTLHQLTTMAGMFGITIEEFVYCIARNKPKQKTKTDKWFLSDIRDKGDKLFPEVKN